VSDIQLAVLFVAFAAIAWYVRGGLARESGPSGLLEAKASLPADQGRDGIRCLLLGHFCSLLVCIPLLASSPFSIDEGHSMGRWLNEFMAAWLRWAAVVQLAYLVPLWHRLRAERRPAAARALLLAGGVTACVSGLVWAARLYYRPQSPFSLQAAAGILALTAVSLLLWCGQELRRSLRA
jgi:hypothetical protein